MGAIVVSYRRGRPAVSCFGRVAILLVALASLWASSALAAGAAGVPRFGHVFLIVGENTSYEQITPAHAPFFSPRVVKPRGAWLTNNHSFVKSSSLGQYIAMLSGHYTKCEANNDLPDHCHQRVGNLFSQLGSSGRSWRDWVANVRDSNASPQARVPRGQMPVGGQRCQRAGGERESNPKSQRGRPPATKTKQWRQNRADSEFWIRL